MTVQDILPTGTYTIRNATTHEYVTVHGPAKTATLVLGNKEDGVENAAVSWHYRKGKREPMQTS